MTAEVLLIELIRLLEVHLHRLWTRCIATPLSFQH